nr:hypothetical protein [Methylorubrum zatmanii]
MASDANAGIVGVLRAQSRLQALDFWVRYPDYLANELLNEFLRGGMPEDLELAARILGDREPDLRRVPMVRYLFGAFEPLDNPLSLLRSRDLVRQRKTGQPGQVRETWYLLTRSGGDAMERLAGEADELAWYRDRAIVAARVAGGVGGRALKGRQYLQDEYAATPIGGVIPSISEKVRERLEVMRGMGRE